MQMQARVASEEEKLSGSAFAVRISPHELLLRSEHAGVENLFHHVAETGLSARNNVPVKFNCHG